MMDNETRPHAPNVSEGCHECGGGKNEMLQSRLRNGASIALCSKCIDLKQNQLSTKNFEARA